VTSGLKKLSDLQAGMLGVLSHVYPRTADAVDLYDFFWKSGYIQRQIEAEGMAISIPNAMEVFSREVEGVCAAGLAEQVEENEGIGYRLTLAGTEYVQKCLAPSSDDEPDLVQQREVLQRLSGGRPC
jgi:hypothetical protein